MASSEEFYIVGIGASAGGLHALEQFFRTVPDDCPAAFVVIQHLSPDFDSLMDELLARHTKLPIHKVVEGIRIEAGGIYLIPPRFDMTIADGVLHLNEHMPGKGLHLPINIFFESLAQAVGERAIGVILSGSGADGAQGIQHIHDSGGFVIVQQPESAEFDSMPQRALATGVANMQLRPEQMPARIMNHIHGVDEPDVPRDEAPSDQDDELSLILEILRDHYRVDFQAYKLTTLVRRLERRLMLRDVDSLEEYITLLHNDLQEVDALYRDFLVEVTHFFRDPEAFDILRNKGIIDELISRADEVRGLRIWVPGCATGQEAYTLAMVIDSTMARRNQHLPVKIFATDVHQHSLSIASTGYYEQKQLNQLPEEYARHYFQPTRNGFQVNPNLRQMIVFAPHDLTQDPPFTQIDLVSCRNVLIYFTESAQSRILENLHYSLKMNGYLLLGPSEHLGAIDKEFNTINSRWRIFRKVRNTQFRRYSNFASLARASTHPPSTASNSGFVNKDTRQWQEALLDRYVPVGFLVDNALSLVYTFGNAGKYLEPPTGTSTLNLLRMVNHELGLALRAAIFRAQKEQKAVVYRGVNWHRGGESKTLSITARPILGDTEQHQYYMLELREESAPEDVAEVSELYSASGQSIEQVKVLEQELLYTKEHLQMTIEELETTNEELQSANEELIASNEELQSTNEELHSVNEELYTVNAEYQRKIDELVQVTNDMRVLQEHTQIGVLFLDAELNIRNFTPAAASVFDLLPQDVGRPLSHLLYNIDLSRSEFLHLAQQVMQTSDSAERNIRSASGQYFEMSILPYKIGEEVNGVVLTFIDNSQLQAQQVVAERYAKELDAYRRFAQLVILRLDTDGRIQQMNQIGCKLLGYTEKEALGESWLERMVPESLREEERTQLDELLACGQDANAADSSVPTVERTIPVLDSAGDEQLFSWRFIPLHDDTNAITSIMLLGLDLTETQRLRSELDELRLELEDTASALADAQWDAPSSTDGSSDPTTEQISALKEDNLRLVATNNSLEQKNKDLMRSNAELDSFVHIASHDLREPLRNIAQYARFLEEDHHDALNDDGLDMLDSIRQQSDHLASLLDDLRTYSVINRTQNGIRPTDLNELVQTVLEQLASLISESGVYVEIEKALPTLTCSPSHMSTVFQNLIANAIKYNDKAEKHVQISWRTEGNNVIFCVSDNGIGIDERYTERIFEMFRRLHGQNEFGGGTGAGLAIVKKYIESTGGQIWLESEVGVGTTFYFTMGESK